MVTYQSACATAVLLTPNHWFMVCSQNTCISVRPRVNVCSISREPLKIQRSLLENLLTHMSSSWRHWLRIFWIRGMSTLITLFYVEFFAWPRIWTLTSRCPWPVVYLIQLTQSSLLRVIPSDRVTEIVTSVLLLGNAQAVTSFNFLYIWVAQPRISVDSTPR